MPNTEDYLLGTDDTESVRLGIQHRLWSAQAAAIWERARIGPGSRVLDVGPGPGYAAADLAELVGPGGRVLGVEGSPRYVELFRSRMSALGHGHAAVVKGDIHHLATLVRTNGDEAGSFDAAYCRWVLSFSPDVSGVLAQIGACLTPGGRIAIQDYFNWRAMSLAPRRPEFTRVIEAILAFWESGEGSNDVMAVVPRLLRDASFRLEHFSVNQRIARPGEPLWNWPDSFWPSIIPRVVDAGFLTEPESRAFFAAWRDASMDPDCFMMVPPVFDAVAVWRG
ncbi:MAG: methyltransferase domain-containing protein [Phycisphaeraceae bacterium]|nr:MAG: methyltransferase domain-containing protein [Phycisphaeraceae bacterium]